MPGEETGWRCVAMKTDMRGLRELAKGHRWDLVLLMVVTLACGLLVGTVLLRRGEIAKAVGKDFATPLAVPDPISSLGYIRFGCASGGARGRKHFYHASASRSATATAAARVRGRPLRGLLEPFLRYPRHRTNGGAQPGFRRDCRQERLHPDQRPRGERGNEDPGATQWGIDKIHGDGGGH